MQFITAAALRFDHRFIGKDREILAILRFGTDNGVMEDVATALHRVFRHQWPFRIAEQTRMHPREMTKVGKIFQLARRITLPGKGASLHHLPIAASL